MDVDNDIDSQLLQQFSQIQTTDREVLVAEFQRLLGNQLGEDGCIFFLDMNNWNLQAAVCSYFEYGQPSVKVPQMSFVKDITIGEGESIPPNTKFTKTWRVQNSGDEPWPYGCYLKFVGGNKFGETDCVMVETLQAGACADVSVEMISPLENGIHQGQWRMSTANGLFFGECIWVILQVDEGGILSVTQLLSQFGCSEFGEERPRTCIDNPYLQQSQSPETSQLSEDGRQQQQCSAAPLYPRTEMSSSSSVTIPTSANPRHSSLPSSPRWFGELGSSSIHFSAESLHPRPVLFQTPDNSPSKTLSSSKKNMNPNSSDIDSMEMS